MRAPFHAGLVPDCTVPSRLAAIRRSNAWTSCRWVAASGRHRQPVPPGERPAPAHLPGDGHVSRGAGGSPRAADAHGVRAADWELRRGPGREVRREVGRQLAGPGIARGGGGGTFVGATPATRDAWTGEL